MRVRALLLLLALLAGAPAAAQPVGGPFAGSQSGFNTYKGPGDVLAANWKFWGGMRAFSAAIASAHGTLATLVRVTDSATTSLTALSNGSANVTAALSFAGTDATCTGSISGTTMTCAATLHIGDFVQGAGVTAGTVVLSGASPTWTVSQSQTVGSTTLTMAVGLSVGTLADQTGNANPFSFATVTGQPLFVPNGSPNGRACMFNASGTTRHLDNTTITGVAQPYTWTFVAFVNTGSSNGQFEMNSASGGPGDLFSSSTLWALFAGSTVTYSATIATWAFEQSVFNGASSVADWNNSSHTLSPGSTGITQPTHIMDTVFNTNPLLGYMCEIGLNTTAIGATDRGNLYTNTHTYWGF